MRILTLPRIFGYVFNPVSVWCGYGPRGDLRAVLYEISNTFGQWHHHLHPVDGLDPAGNSRHVFEKELSVSPFIEMDATYEFRMRPPEERAALPVREHLPSGHLLTATFVARRKELTAGSLWREFAFHPMVTMKVIGGIHWEALRLWLKGAPFRRHGPAPDRLVTVDARREGTPSDDGPSNGTILEVVCRRMRRGSLTVRWPDGTIGRFEGARPGPRAEIDLHDFRVVRRLG